MSATGRRDGNRRESGEIDVLQCAAVAIEKRIDPADYIGARAGVDGITVRDGKRHSVVSGEDSGDQLSKRRRKLFLRTAAVVIRKHETRVGNPGV